MLAERCRGVFMRPGQLPSQLLDSKAWLLRKDRQPGGYRAGMPGSRLNS
jgi:hypothetical protein